MNVHSRVTGKGEPVVLIHGLFGSMENLGGIARWLSDAFRVYSIDLPNHGRSSHTEALSLSLMADAVETWLDEQGLERVSIFGHSLGGKVAMELALRCPDRISRLVIVDIAPVKYSARHRDVFEGLQAIQPEKIASRGEADDVLSQYVSEPAVRSFLLKNLVRDASGFSWRMNLPVIAKGYDSLIMENTAGGQFAKPVLFLKGGDSDYIKTEHREAILARFPLADLKVVQNTGHWLHAEKPELVAKLAKRFLEA